MMMMQPMLQRKENSRKDGLMFQFIMNVALLFLAIISVTVNRSECKLFTYRWTARLTGLEDYSNMTAAAETIQEMYAENQDSSSDHLGMMMDQIFSLSRCEPAIFGGELQWDQAGASPTCNCLRNIHLEYVKAVRPNGIGMLPEHFNETDNRVRVDQSVAKIKERCFTSLRNTQVM